MLVRVKEVTTTALADEQKTKNSDTHREAQIAALDYERRSAIAVRMMECVSQAFHAIGAGAQTQELIYWNLSMTGNLGRDDVLDKPAEFIEGVKAIYGEAGIKVFEYMLIRELKKEFGVTDEFEKESAQEKNTVPELLRLIASTAK